MTRSTDTVDLENYIYYNSATKHAKEKYKFTNSKLRKKSQNQKFTKIETRENYQIYSILKIYIISLPLYNLRCSTLPSVTRDPVRAGGSVL